jgi:ABC-type multidrug transport system fused ATPase/permease subunit
MLRQEIGFFNYESNSVGAPVTRLSSDASSIEVNLSSGTFLLNNYHKLSSQGLTGVRIGIILQAASAMVVALFMAFYVGWRLTLVVIRFAPLMMFSGIIQGQKHGKVGQSKDKGSFTEQAGQVLQPFVIYINHRMSFCMLLFS